MSDQEISENPAGLPAVPAPDQAIRDLLDRLTDAWNRGDGEGYAAGFTDASDYIAFDGTHLHGREANARHHQALFDGVLSGTRLLFEGEPSIRLVAESVAIVHTMGSVVWPWQAGVTKQRRSNQTLVALRTGHGWRFTAFHNTRYRPLRPPRGLLLALFVGFTRMRTILSGRRERGVRRGA